MRKTKREKVLAEMLKNVPAVNLPVQAKKDFTRNLMCMVLLRAVEDYVGEFSDTTKITLPAYYFDKATILRDLRSSRMVSLTDGLSLTVANALLSNPDQIKENLQNITETYDVAKVGIYDTPQYR